MVFVLVIPCVFFCIHVVCFCFWFLFQLFHAFCLLMSLLRFAIFDSFLTHSVPNFLCLCYNHTVLFYVLRIIKLCRIFFCNRKDNCTTQVHILYKMRHRESISMATLLLLFRGPRDIPPKTPKSIQTFLYSVINFIKINVIWCRFESFLQLKHTSYIYFS